MSPNQPVPVLFAIHRRLASVAHARERSCAVLMVLLLGLAAPLSAQQPQAQDTRAVTTAVAGSVPAVGVRTEQGRHGLLSSPGSS